MMEYKIMLASKSIPATEAALNLLAAEGWFVVNMTDHMILMGRELDENDNGIEEHYLGVDQ